MKQQRLKSSLISFLFTWFGLVPYKLYEGPGIYNYTNYYFTKYYTTSSL